MTFDQTIPPKLKQTQKWFASIITRPLMEGSRLNPTSPKGESMDKEASKYISPSPALRPAQRIELYNQQYWWRLLSVMQENFPFLTRLFGYHDFNQTISIPYLVKYPSSHWSLNMLGERLEKWIKEDYHADDKDLISIAASLDWGYCSSFSARSAPPVNLESLPVAGNIDSLLTAKLYLQPHIRLYHFTGDYLNLRYEMLKESVEHWVDNDFPPLEREQKNYFSVLYRNHQTNLAWKTVSEAEYMLLNQFSKGTSIDECCNWLGRQKKTAYKKADENIQAWFKEWVERHWLTLEKPQSEKKHVRSPRKTKIPTLST
jgi:hypothetical protein